MSKERSPSPAASGKDILAPLEPTMNALGQQGLFAAPTMEKSASNASSIGLGIMGAPGVEISISTNDDGGATDAAVSLDTRSPSASSVQLGSGSALRPLPPPLSSSSSTLSPPSSKSQSLSPAALGLRAEPESPYLPLFPTPNPMTNSPYTPFPNTNGTFPRSDYVPNAGLAPSSLSPTSSPTSRNTNIMTPPSPASPAFMRAAYPGGNGGAGGFEKWRSDVRKGSPGYGALGDGGEAMIAGGESPTKKTAHGMVADRPRPMLMRTPPTNPLLSGPEILNADHFHPETSGDHHTHDHDEEGDEYVAELPMSPQRLDFGKAGSPYSPAPHMSPPPLGRRTSGPSFSQSRPYAPQAYPPSPSRQSSNLNPASQTPPSPLQPSSHRVHARNLSLFFPEPGKTPPIPSPSFQPSTPHTPTDAPITTIPSPRFGPAGGFAYQTGGSLSKGSGFKFGGAPETGAMGPPALPLGKDQPKSPLLGMGAADGATLAPPPSPARFGKRGHHHKHSLSHNFFSFLDPTATNPALAEGGPSRSPENGSPSLNSIPSSAGLATPKPVANTFVSGAPTSQSIHTSTTASLLPSPSMQASSTRSRISIITDLAPASQLAIGIGVAEFFVGASIWVEGQATGSVGLTGLGYLVVFDAMGMAISVAGELMKLGDRGMSSIRRPFGSYRTESLLYFVQAIFLLFASVYIAKEAVEHVLISGHDHETDFNESRFPAVLLSAALLSCLVGGGYMRNHAKLVEAVGTHFTAGFNLGRRVVKSSENPSGLDCVLGNPFSTAIAGILALALAGSTLLPEEQFVNLDKVLALAETFITFRLSYPASVALGQVLLQTSPPETNVQVLALRRAVEDVEDHPAVISVGTPHIWQLTPHQPESPRVPQQAPRTLTDTPRHSPAPSRTSSYSDFADLPGGVKRPALTLRNTPVSSPTTPTFSSLPSVGCTLVATIEICVREDADDTTVLDVTRFAYERCNTAIGARVLGWKKIASIEQGEVTVMVRKGHRDKLGDHHDDHGHGSSGHTHHKHQEHGHHDHHNHHDHHDHHGHSAQEHHHGHD